ncbi:ImmA/IrrE family metallo-endopeptidase [Succinimonas sp.]|uniref:ImmA/IrrE family metallo-endopeptidase n=1 Tax=Succinimonas sp. TaxID=1936151 RepID=UPI00386A37B9
MAGITYESDLLNILQIVRSALQIKGFYVFEMPFADEEIGAVSYRGDGAGYIVVNTSLPRVNVNFALSHEVYHVLFGNMAVAAQVAFADDAWHENEEEYRASQFAGTLLMPEVSFRRMYAHFRYARSGNESQDDVFSILAQLVSYYQVPYMAVLIRCLELDLLPGDAITEELLSPKREAVRQKLADLWLDETIMDASLRDDYPRMESLVERLGKEYSRDGYINDRTVSKALRCMRELSSRIKREF